MCWSTVHIGAATQRQITQRNCHKTFMLLNIYVPKRITTKRSCHTMKVVIKCQTSQKVNITKRQMFQNITSQNKNRHKTTKKVYPNLTLYMIRETQQNNTWISWACTLT
jgi:hypothetical protein